MPLCFNMDRVKAITGDIKLRMFPNQAYDAYIAHSNGIHGQWVRPEDTDLYAEYIDTFEFIAKDLTTERTMFHIYAENKSWPGNLNLLIINLDANVDNRGIPSDLAKSRLNCGQRCEMTNTCHLCDMGFAFVNAVDKNKSDLKQST